MEDNGSDRILNSPTDNSTASQRERDRQKERETKREIDKVRVRKRDRHKADKEQSMRGVLPLALRICCTLL